MQQDSTKLRRVEEQIPLIPPAAPQSRPVSIDRIYTLTDTHEALLYACELARRPAKQLYGEMGVDKTTWSRIVGGEWDLPGRNIHRFNRAVGNNAYLQYLMHQDEIDLTSVRRVQDDQERRIAELEGENRELRTAIRLWAEAQRGKG